MSTKTGSPTRPVLRWHGGKWVMAPWIIEHLPPHRIYVEPFGGAASVLLRKPRSYAEVYNDLSEDVVNLFRVLRQPSLAAELRMMLELTPFARREFEDAYLPVEPPSPCHGMDMGPIGPDPVEMARRFVVRSFQGFGSSGTRAYRTGFRSKAYRQNQTGAADWQSYPEALSAFTSRLQGVTIECRPALQVIEQQDEAEALFYIDPPYTLDTRSTHNSCPSNSPYQHDMVDADHVQLAACLVNVAGMVVVSGYRSDLYDTLYKGWERFDRNAHASGSNGAVKRVESIWLNRAATEARSQMSFDMEVTA